MARPVTNPRRPSQTLGDYVLLHRIAYGGMAELFAARRSGSDVVVALKRILPELVGDRVFIDMFVDEARIAATLDHPNVVRVHETGTTEGQHYMVMEYLRGRDLGGIFRALRRRVGGVSPQAAVTIVSRAAAGLHYAHEKCGADGTPLRIVHRDVSPRNVFVTEAGEVKILDFGIAKARDRLSVTRTGTVKGKFPYMAPEAIRDEPVDRRADVFSLGVLFWELLTGQRLFTGGSDYEIIKKILSQPISRPSSVIPSCPRELESVVMRALRSDPERRQPSAAAFQADLFAVGAALDLQESSASLTALLAELFPGQVNGDEDTGEIATVADRASARRGPIGRLLDSFRRRG